MKLFLGEHVSLDRYRRERFRDQEFIFKREFVTKNRAAVAWADIWVMGNGRQPSPK